MNRFFLCLLLIFAHNSDLYAQEAPKFVRKQIRPTFFVPEKEFDKKEELPPFILPKKNLNNEVSEVVEPVYISPNDINYNNSPANQAEALNEIDISKNNQTIDATKLLPKNPNIVFEDKLEDTISYERAKKQYDGDIKEISKTHKLPNNPTLRKNLLKMDSNNRIQVENNFGI